VGKRKLAVAVVTALVATGAVATAGADQSYRIVVNPSVKGTQIPRATLNSIFLRQAPRWGDGTPVQPVDQSFRSRVRQSFVNEVHQRPVMELQIFWNRRMATGVTPPPVKQSDEEILAYVAATPGAIGYVAAATPVPDSVREIAVIE
jgi:ABC-type phosphate transport system substrate-binding protein